MLKRFSVKNFASCADVTVDLNRPVTALIGKNGVGKTNLLRAIEFFARTITSRQSVSLSRLFTVRPVDQEFVAEFEISGYAYIYRLLIRIQALFGRSELPSVEETLQILDPSEASGVRTVFRREGPAVTLGLANADTTLAINAMVPALPAMISLLPSDWEIISMHLLPVNNFFLSFQYYTLEEKSDPVVSEIVLESQYQAQRQKFLATGEHGNSVGFKLIYLNETRQDLLAEFTDILGPKGLGLVQFAGVIKQTAQQPSVATSSEPPRVFYLIHFFPLQGMAGSGQAFAYANLSAGTRRVIRAVLALVFDLKSLMLVEQPEDSIHSSLLEKLLDVFRSYSGRTQFVFSTHSSMALNIVAPEDILLLTADEGITQVRALAAAEVSAAKVFMENEGSLSDYLETFQN